MFTLKTRYALRALVDLAVQSRGELGTGSATGDGRLHSAREIAARTAIPPKYLEVVLGDLAAAGCLVSQKGKYGGHRLARPADGISVLDVVRATDPGWQTGRVAPAANALTNAPDAGVEVEAAAVQALEAQFAAVLRRTTLDQVLATHQAASRNLNYAI